MIESTKYTSKKWQESIRINSSNYKHLFNLKNKIKIYKIFQLSIEPKTKPLILQNLKKVTSTNTFTSIECTQKI